MTGFALILFLMGANPQYYGTYDTKASCMTAAEEIMMVANYNETDIVEGLCIPVDVGN